MSSPDYVTADNKSTLEQKLKDLRTRVKNYEAAYETVGSTESEKARGESHTPSSRIWRLHRPYLVYIRTKFFVFGVNRDPES